MAPLTIPVILAYVSARIFNAQFMTDMYDLHTCVTYHLHIQCVAMHTYIHAHVHTPVQTRAHAHMRTCTHITYTHVMHTLFILRFVFVVKRKHSYLHAHVPIYLHACTHRSMHVNNKQYSITKSL